LTANTALMHSVARVKTKRLIKVHKTEQQLHYLHYCSINERFRCIIFMMLMPGIHSVWLIITSKLCGVSSVFLFIGRSANNIEWRLSLILATYSFKTCKTTFVI